MSIKNIVLLFMAIVFSGCGVEKFNRFDISYEIIQIPDELDIANGEEGIFIIKTSQGYNCIAAVQYWDADNENRVVFIPSVIAGADGFCTLRWQIPDNFNYSKQFPWANLLVEINNEHKTEYLEPQTFCLDHCP
jgi:hypothetical protein